MGHGQNEQDDVLPSVRAPFRDGQDQVPCILVPEDQFFRPVPVKIPKELVVVLIGTGVLDQASLPGFIGPVFRGGILPPPDLVGAPFPAKGHIQVPVPVNVVDGRSCFNKLLRIVNDIAVPAATIVF